MPAIPADLFRVQQSRDNDDRPGTKAWLLNLHARFTNHQNIRKRIGGLLINRMWRARFGPLDDVVARTEAFASSEVDDIQTWE